MLRPSRVGGHATTTKKASAPLRVALLAEYEAVVRPVHRLPWEICRVDMEEWEEMERKQDKYDKQLRKILNDSQYAAYEKVKPKFASQRMYRDFLLFGNTSTKEGQ